MVGTAGLPWAALGGGKAPGWDPVGLPRRSVAGGVVVPGGLGRPADGTVELPGAGRWFGAAGGTLPAGAVAVAAGLP